MACECCLSTAILARTASAPRSEIAALLHSSRLATWSTSWISMIGHSHQCWRQRNIGAIPIPQANRQGIEEYVALLQAADALLLIYPTWWYGLPAMLKGWLDRVWVPGVAFRLSPGAIQPSLTNIHRIGVVTTYGSPNWLLWFIGWPDRRMIGRGLRRLCAQRCRLDWLGLTNIDNRTTAERQAFLTKVQKRLGSWK